MVATNERIETMKLTATDAMDLYGGGFVKAFSICLMRADTRNRKRLFLAFPEIIERYQAIADAMNAKNEAEKGETE